MGNASESMKPYLYRPNRILAVQIGEQDFERPHPHPDDIPGITYSNEHRYAALYEGSVAAFVGTVGDWIVKREYNDAILIVDEHAFDDLFEPATAPASVKG